MSKHIMVVDDHMENRYLLRALFEGHGFSVTEASDGTEALTKSRASAPDVVVTDLLMPGMDGFTFCRKWMMEEGLKHVPLVVYTATYTDPEDRRLALDLGAAAFVIKPVELSELVSIVSTVMANVEQPEPSPNTARDGVFYERYALRLQNKLERKLGQLATADKHLNEHVTRCEAILDATTNAIVAIDPVRRIKTWNLRAEEMFGYVEEQVLNRSLDPFTPPELRQELERRLELACNAKRAVNFETKWPSQSGALLDVEITLSCLGSDLGHMLVISDLTQVREAAAEKERLEQQLRLAQRMEAIGLLAGGVAHDFNNLLTAILYHSESIENNPQGDELSRTDARYIREAGERAASLTRQLLAFSRRQAVKLEVVDLAELVSDMGTMLRRLIPEDVELTIGRAGEPSYVEGDRSQLEQVVLNLAINARDAMPDGGQLALRFSRLDLRAAEPAAVVGMQPGSYVVLSVADSGIGMDNETRKRAFEPFFTTKSHGKGTGLGLATVYGIVRQAKGCISVSSRLGAGTTFEVFLPRVEKVPSASRPILRGIEHPAGGETILVVEDEEMVRRVACRILARAGYKVIQAADGKAALKLVAEMKEPLQLLLADVVLPGTSGRQLAERILAQSPSTKVVFTSGYTDETIAHHGVLHPGVTLLEKPFSIHSLTKIIRAVLDGSEPGGIGTATGGGGPEA